jgi:hypothetical protein
MITINGWLKIADRYLKETIIQTAFSITMNFILDIDKIFEDIFCLSSCPRHGITMLGAGIVSCERRLIKGNRILRDGRVRKRKKQ